MKALILVPCLFYAFLFLFLLTSDDFFSFSDKMDVNNDIAYLAVLPADCSARKLVIDVMKFK